VSAPDKQRRARLDRAVVEQGLAATRSRAHDLIRSGCVLVDGLPVKKPATLVTAASEITLSPAAWSYVSRGALKLREALDTFGYAVDGRTGLDVGASTGGFTQIMLERGAKRVYAVDVGRDQLSEQLRADHRVVALDSVDVRKLNRDLIAEPIEMIAVDVSFISLRKALPVPLSFAARQAWLVALIKPQFEVGRAAVGKGGIVREESEQQQAIASVQGWLEAQTGWTVDGVIPSPIEGRKGNREFLIGARHAP